MVPYANVPSTALGRSQVTQFNVDTSEDPRPDTTMYALRVRTSALAASSTASRFPGDLKGQLQEALRIDSVSLAMFNIVVLDESEAIII